MGQGFDGWETGNGNDTISNVNEHNPVEYEKELCLHI